nr:hypothetical protein CFP56_09031 [Quercus suber]
MERKECLDDGGNPHQVSPHRQVSLPLFSSPVVTIMSTALVMIRRSGLACRQMSTCDPEAQLQETGRRESHAVQGKPIAAEQPASPSGRENPPRGFVPTAGVCPSTNNAFLTWNYRARQKLTRSRP